MTDGRETIAPSRGRILGRFGAARAQEEFAAGHAGIQSDPRREEKSGTTTTE